MGIWNLGRLGRRTPYWRVLGCQVSRRQPEVGGTAGILLRYEGRGGVSRGRCGVCGLGAGKLQPARADEASGRGVGGIDGGTCGDSRAVSRRANAAAQLLSCGSVGSDCGQRVRVCGVYVEVGGQLVANVEIKVELAAAARGRGADAACGVLRSGRTLKVCAADVHTKK